MKVNGREVSLNGEKSVKQFLEEQGYPLKSVAVERNQEIVPKLSYDTTMLTEADTLEIVSFVGGG